VAVVFDGPNRRILLDGATTVSVRELYSRWVDWSVDNLQYLPAFRTIADPPTVPVYAFLTNDWCVVPVGGVYTLIINDGFLDTDSLIMEVFCPADPGPEPRIRFDKPAVAIGYSTTGMTPDEAATIILSGNIEGSITLQQALRLMLAVAAGKSAVTGSQIVFRDTQDVRDRVVATVAAGARTSVTVDPS
jgi:hypothetical protein